MSVFVSHATGDQKVAVSLAQNLNDKGIATWLAFRDIAPGTAWHEAITTALARCSAVVLIFSAGADKSVHVGRELALADAAEVPVLAVMIDDATPERLRYYLATYQWFEWKSRNPADLTPLLQRLTELEPALEVEADKPDPSTPAPMPPAPSAPRVSRRRARSIGIVAGLGGVLVAVATVVTLQASGGSNRPPSTSKSSPIATTHSNVSTTNSPHLAESSRTVALAGDLGSGVVAVKGSVEALALSPSGRTLYASSYDTDSVFVMSTLTREVGSPIRVGRQPAGLAVSPDGQRLYVANVGSRTVSVISTTTAKVLKTVPDPDGPVGVAVSPNNEYVYVSTSSGTVSILSTTTNTITGHISVGGHNDGILVSPDGSTLYIIDGGQNIEVASTTSMRFVRSIHVGGGVLGMALCSDGRVLYAATGNKVAQISTASETVLQYFNAPTGPLISVPGAVDVVTTSDGRYVFLAPTGRAPAVLDTTNRSVTRPLIASNDQALSLTSVALAPDDRYAYFGSSKAGQLAILKVG